MNWTNGLTLFSIHNYKKIWQHHKDFFDNYYRFWIIVISLPMMSYYGSCRGLKYIIELYMIIAKIITCNDENSRQKLKSDYLVCCEGRMLHFVCNI